MYLCCVRLLTRERNFSTHCRRSQLLLVWWAVSIAAPHHTELSPCSKYVAWKRGLRFLNGWIHLCLDSCCLSFRVVYSVQDSLTGSHTGYTRGDVTGPSWRDGSVITAVKRVRERGDIRDNRRKSIDLVQMLSVCPGLSLEDWCCPRVLLLWDTLSMEISLKAAPNGLSWWVYNCRQ